MASLKEMSLSSCLKALVRHGNNDLDSDYLLSEEKSII